MKYAILTILLLIGCTSAPETVVENIEKNNSQNEPPEKFLSDHPKSIEYSVHITGEDMKSMTLGEIADLWGVSGSDLANEVKDFYKIDGVDENTVMDSLKDKTTYVPKKIKDLAQSLKQ